MLPNNGLLVGTTSSAAHHLLQMGRDVPSGGDESLNAADSSRAIAGSSSSTPQGVPRKGRDVPRPPPQFAHDGWCHRRIDHSNIQSGLPFLYTSPIRYLESLGSLIRGQQITHETFLTA